MFVYSDIAECNKKCYEDDVTNRMKESLILFEEIINSMRYSESKLIILFNNTRFFVEKWKRKDFKDYIQNVFNDFPLNCNNAQEAMRFIRKKFLNLNRGNAKRIMTMFVDLTDTTAAQTMLQHLTYYMYYRPLDYLNDCLFFPRLDEYKKPDMLGRVGKNYSDVTIMFKSTWVQTNKQTKHLVCVLKQRFVQSERREREWVFAETRINSFIFLLLFAIKQTHNTHTINKVHKVHG